MSRPIIEVSNLSKRYHLGAIGATSLREEVSRYWDRFRGVPHPDRQEFWALRDVSFAVHPGEVVGVIGRNGAGKSTLLKILSRITEPTSGSARLRGRVASLLEVGTGFHPELTGRENVYLNGAILGMSRAEIRRKFDEIVAFAEVEPFIDTPVKRYSSGMYVRLAFAVAAHLEPEILIVDEVLAVGDAVFQKKCLGKLGEVSTRGGRTVLFVSHNMAATSSLCARAIWLKAGRIHRIDDARRVVAGYSMHEVEHPRCGVVDLRNVARQGGDQMLRFTAIRLLNGQGQVSSAIENFQPFTVELDFEVARPFAGEIELTVRNADEVPVMTTSTRDVNRTLAIQAGAHTIRCNIDPNHLCPGRYWLQVSGVGGTVRDLITHALEVEVIETVGVADGSRHGPPTLVHFNFQWGLCQPTPGASR